MSMSTARILDKRKERFRWRTRSFGIDDAPLGHLLLHLRVPDSHPFLSSTIPNFWMDGWRIHIRIPQARASGPPTFVSDAIQVSFFVHVPYPSYYSLIFLQHA